MNNQIFQKIKASLRSANQWVTDTPERALEGAYNAALQIKAIEDEHFNGKKISPRNVDYGESVMAYFEAELQKNINIAKQKLNEFNTIRSLFSLPNRTALLKRGNAPENYNGLNPKENPAVILEKLKFIDRVISKYRIDSLNTQDDQSLSLVVVPQDVKLETSRSEGNVSNGQIDSFNERPNRDKVDKTENISDQTGVVPRSILRTFTRLSRELNPKAEEDMVKKFRNSQAKTAISLRFILLLIVIPLLTFQISKLFIVGPLVERYFEKPTNPIGIFLNSNLEEEALKQLQMYEEKLNFQVLIGKIPQLSPEVKEEKIKLKAEELAEEYTKESANAVKNILSDLFSLFAFGFVIFKSRKEIEVLKSFIDEIVYGLSDSAKAFIIILFTDVFVGFHSPHGWEVLLEGISRHWGLPENRSFIYLFIATFPVVLDTIFKYWIFRYLNRISPSAVATYRNMNE